MPTFWADLAARFNLQIVYAFGSRAKEVASPLAQAGILSAETAQLMKQMAGNRNRLVHFYHEVSTEELYTLCANNLEDNRAVIQEITDWLNTHPQIMDDEL